MEIRHLVLFFVCLLQGFDAAPPVEVTPKNIILLEHMPLEVKCKVNAPLTYCRYLIPGVGPLNLRPSLPPHEGIRYVGAGLQQGECGMIIRSVSSKHSGVIQCSMGLTDESTESAGNMTLIVAKPPDPPELRVTSGQIFRESFQEGETIHATCEIKNARPVANISWFLGSEPIYDKLSRAVTEEENGLSSISQNLTRTVTYTDHGKDLKCVAGHMALGREDINHSIYKLNIRFPPKPKSQELEKFGFTIGQPGKIVVTFQANPIPDIIWKVDHDSLKQGTRDSTGRFEAGLLQKKDAGTWDAVLNIKIVRPEEVEKRYTLIAQNELGREAYKVAISTSPEPPTNITAGAIVGIVIAVLVILLLVFIAIFARATGKWCFAGGVPRPVGESRNRPLRWSLHSSKKKKNAVNSLVYKEYTLIEGKDGTRSYVSPEGKVRLDVEEKIKAAQRQSNLDKRHDNSPDSDSSSDGGYEIPIGTERPVRQKESDSSEVDGSRDGPKKSQTFGDGDNDPEETVEINLPFYMEPLEGAVAVASTKTEKRKRHRKEKKKQSDLQDEPESAWLNLGEDETSGKNSTKSTFPRIPFRAFWRNQDPSKSHGNPTTSFHPFGVIRKKNPQQNRNDIITEVSDSRETQVKHLMAETPENPPRKNLSFFPWSLEAKQTQAPGEKPAKDSSPDIKSSKYLPAFKLPSLSWTKRKNPQEDVDVDGRGPEDSDPVVGPDPYETGTPQRSENASTEGLASVSSPLGSIEPAPGRSLLNLLTSDLQSGLQEPEEVFPEDQPTPAKTTLLSYKIDFTHLKPEEKFDRPETVQKLTYGDRLFRYSNLDSYNVKSRRNRNAGKIDPNPLRNMFGVRRPKSQISSAEEGGKDNETPVMEEGKREDSGREAWVYASPRLVKSEPGAETDGNSFAWVHKTGHGGLMGAMMTEDSEVANDHSDGSDTESADHGSTDKSSMSKLTQDKQPKKLMNGLFGSFRKGKTRNRQIDSEFGKNPFNYDVSIKEQEPQVPEQVQVDAPRAEGIVYAELDMARSPGTLSVMRRDDEKTEYAEIIYPTSKGPERVLDDLRKSRENLVASRENLAAEAEDELTTTVTPEGKKEAAV